jgi:ribosomal protein S18 acetylase RimI-like enzyme
MGLSFASPTGAIIALALALPLGALALFESRAHGLRASLRLPQPRLQAHLVTIVSLAAIGVLLALAAAQPVLARETPLVIRADAEAYVVFDVTLSMAASAQPGSPTRLQRAKHFALRLRDQLPELRVGVASFTQRSVPHLFPTADRAVFTGVVEESVQIWEPRPAGSFRPGTRATDLESVAELGGNGYFAPEAKKRLLVVFTDGESIEAFPERIAAGLRRGHKVKMIFVHLWGADERIHLSDGRIDPNYRSDPAGAQLLTELAAETNGRVFAEDELPAAVDRARAEIGGGPTTRQGIERSRTPLAPWLVLIAAIPLGAVLRRRNL